MRFAIKNKKLKNNLALLLISACWGIVGITIIWHLIGLIWVIYYTLISKSIYVPESVKLTSYSIIAVLTWAIIIFLLIIVWVKYNDFLMLKKSRVKYNSNHLIFIEKELTWSEAIITKVDSQNILGEVEKVKNNLAVVNIHKSIIDSYKNNIEPHKLLNSSILLINNGQFLDSASILRTILEHPESSPLIKEVAKVKLSQCLYELGYKDLANGFVEKVI